MTEPGLDVICLGRAAVDLYGIQQGGRLEDVQTFARYVGGSSANVAVGLARLGVRSAMPTRVGDEPMGRFVREALATEGVDVSRVATDPRRLTGLVVLGIRDSEHFPHVFFRENCADMALDVSDFDERFITSARALAITGTHLSTEHVRAVCRQAVAWARAAGTRVALDIDYRPVLWGLAPASDGASRYAASAEVTAHLQSFLPDCALVVGTEEEIRIAGGADDLIAALRAIRRLCGATIVMKRGIAGCVIFEGDIPGAIEHGAVVPGFPVPVLNVLGAGDAFLAGFLSGWLDGRPARECARLGNACGALVVSRHGCAPAMPTREELEDYLQRAASIPSPTLDRRLNHLHRGSLRPRCTEDLFILAFDHRRQLEQLALEHEAPLERLNRFKTLIAEGVERTAAHVRPGRIGILVDDGYGRQVLDRYTGGSWWIGRPVEVPGSRPLQFQPGASIGAQLATWPKQHVVKCLVQYHPDDPVDLRLAQEEQLVLLHEECVNLQRDLLVEVISTGLGHAQTTETTANIMRRFYNIGVFPEWWKIEAPPPDAWPQIEAVIHERDPYCRGVLLLGLDVPINELERQFAESASVALCRGFAIGRSIFGPAARAWIGGDIGDADAVRQVAENYHRVIETWQQMRHA